MRGAHSEPSDGPAWWAEPQADLLARLQATPAGLTAEEAEARLRQHGPNRLSPAARCGSSRRSSAARWC